LIRKDNMSAGVVIPSRGNAVRNDLVLNNLKTKQSGTIPIFPNGGLPLPGSSYARQGNLAFEQSTVTGLENTAGTLMYFDGTIWVSVGVGNGDVVGPNGATDNAVARYDGATGKIIQNSLVIIDDLGNLVTPGTITAANISGVNTGNVTLAAVDANGAANANGATLSGLTGQVLNLNSATAIQPGVVNVGAQTFGGAKTFVATLTENTNINFSTQPSTATAGNITKNGTRFLHNIGTNNTFLGINAGNFAGPPTGTDDVGVGVNALQNFTTGTRNAAIGNNALVALTSGNDNVALGHNALAAETIASQNTAIGSGALSTTTIGADLVAVGFNALHSLSNGSNNTAVGASTLANAANVADTVVVGYNAMSNSNNIGTTVAIGSQAIQNASTSSDNVGIGYRALLACTTGSENVAIGTGALSGLTTVNGCTAIGFRSQLISTGVQNTSVGWNSMLATTVGGANSAFGYEALLSNTTGGANTAVGHQALRQTINSLNCTAVGAHALQLLTGADENTAIGFNASSAVTTGQQNCSCGNNALEAVTTGTLNAAFGPFAGQHLTGGDSFNLNLLNRGVAGDNNTTRIGDNGGLGTTTKCFIHGVRGIMTGVNDALVVMVDSAGQFGTVSSSARFKNTIQDMSDASSGLMNLRPVTFFYNDQEGENKKLQYGLIAEEVANIFPDIVVYDKEGKPETVQYQYLPPMMLNELIKQNATIKKLTERVSVLETVLKKLVG